MSITNRVETSSKNSDDFPICLDRLSKRMSHRSILTTNRCRSSSAEAISKTWYASDRLVTELTIVDIVGDAVVEQKVEIIGIQGEREGSTGITSTQLSETGVRTSVSLSSLLILEGIHWETNREVWFIKLLPTSLKRSSLRWARRRQW